MPKYAPETCMYCGSEVKRNLGSALAVREIVIYECGTLISVYDALIHVATPCEPIEDQWIDRRDAGMTNTIVNLNVTVNREEGAQVSKEDIAYEISQILKGDTLYVKNSVYLIEHVTLTT